MNFDWIKSLLKYGFSVASFLLALSCGKRTSSVSAVSIDLDDRYLPFTKEEIKVLKSGAIVNRSVLLTDEDISDFRNNEKIFYLTATEIDFFNDKNRFEPLAQNNKYVFVCDYEYDASYGGECKQVGKVFVKECTKVMIKNCWSSNGEKTVDKIYKKIIRSSINDCPTCINR